MKFKFRFPFRFSSEFSLQKTENGEFEFTTYFLFSDLNIVFRFACLAGNGIQIYSIESVFFVSLEY